MSECLRFHHCAGLGLVRPRLGRRLRVRDRRQVHQVLLQPRLVLVARLQLAHVLVLKDGEDESLILVEVFFNELGRDHLLGGVPVSLDGGTRRGATMMSAGAG